MTKLHRPCTLPDYWEVQEPLDASKVQGINCGLCEDEIVIETTWEGKSSKLGEPVLRFNDLFEVKSLIESKGVDKFLDLKTIEQEKIRAKYIQQTILTIAKALHAPVKATQAVLDAMEKMPDAKFSSVEKCIAYNRDRKYPIEKDKEGWSYWDNGSFTYLQIGDYIQADCPLALQVLLQFTTEGERI